MTRASPATQLYQNQENRARNQLKGTVVSVDKGPISAKIKIDGGGGNTITSSVTAEAAEDLDLKDGDSVTAIIKASEVLIGK